MAGYLEHYGAGDEKREKRRRNIVLSLLGLIVVSGALYFSYRNYREEKQLTIFFDLLKQQNYKAAYEMWGCTEATPCRDYAYSRFQEDWGPKSKHTDMGAMKVVKTKSCDSGIIRIVNFGDGDLNLWVNRKDRVIGFAPWPVCNPRMPGTPPQTS